VLQQILCCNKQHTQKYSAATRRRSSEECRNKLVAEKEGCVTLVFCLLHLLIVRVAEKEGCRTLVFCLLHLLARSVLTHAWLAATRSTSSEECRNKLAAEKEGCLTLVFCLLHLLIVRVAGT
jgi:hypothetical protein